MNDALPPPPSGLMPPFYRTRHAAGISPYSGGIMSAISFSAAEVAGGLMLLDRCRDDTAYYARASDGAPSRQQGTPQCSRLRHYYIRLVCFAISYFLLFAAYFCWFDVRCG